MSDRARLTIGRDYCRGCKGASRQSFAGYATGDGHENSCRPRAFYRQCEACGTTRLVLGNVNDAEGLCRMVLGAWLKRSNTGAAVGAKDRPFGDGSLDADDGLGFLTAEVWKLYLAWQPKLSDDSFLAYASDLLPRRLNSWSRDASGEASTRAKGRRFPKAHAASVSVSLDGLNEASGGAPAHDDGREERGGADPRFGAFEPDHAETRASDLLRVLTAGGGGRAGDQRGESGAAPVGVAAQDR